MHSFIAIHICRLTYGHNIRVDMCKLCMYAAGPPPAPEKMNNNDEDTYYGHVYGNYSYVNLRLRLSFEFLIIS